jgi:YYY domain-containing protein
MAFGKPTAGDPSAAIQGRDQALSRLESPTLGARLRGLARYLPVVLLVVIIGFALWLRLWGNNWDDGQHIHPDERFLTMVESHIQIPSSLGEYFNSKQSPFNPYNQNEGSFVYGTFPLFFVRIVAEVLDKADYADINLVGRFLAGLFDVGSVLLVFLVGRRLYGRNGGLLAAFLLTVTVLNIQHAHFFVVESFLTFFCLLGIFYSVRIVQDGGWRNYALAGLALGFAVGCKLTALPLLGIIGLAVLMRAWPTLEAVGRGAWQWAKGAEPPPNGADLPTGQAGPAARAYLVISDAVLGLILAVLAAFVVFRIVQPYAFAGSHWWDVGLSQHWIDDMNNLRRQSTGLDFPPNVQWIGRTPFLFPLKNMVVWGMGPALGLAAWGGVLCAVWRTLRHREGKHLLLLAWVLGNLLYSGGRFVTTMRYFLPIYPEMVLLAAFGLLTLWSERWKWALAQRLGAFYRYAKPAVPVVAKGTLIATLVLTTFWALAFTSIYRRPLSRLTATEWIYDNVPEGATIAHEHWDDAIPFSLPGGLISERYGSVEMALYGPDSNQKLAEIMADLDKVDYIAITSNRLYGSIPREPASYPMTTVYYDLLFKEKLGFEIAATFTSYPSLFGVTIPDQGAEEAFTVYDHPKVTILKKTPAYASEDVQATLAAAAPESAVHLTPAEAGKNGLIMRPEEREIQQSGGTWTSLFNPDSFSNRFPAISWLLMLELVSLALLPLAVVIFRHLPDGGYLLTKPLALLAIAYPVWLGTSLGVFHFTRGAILIVAGLLLLVGAAAAFHQRERVIDYVRQHWRAILLGEALFLGAFLAFYFVRMANPDLWHPARGGEKPMDFAYLNAVVRSTRLPPYDPWFSGGYINYYYFGQFITATLIKGTGIVPEVAYNLAVPLFFALTVAATASLGYNLAEVARRRLRRKPGGGRLGASGPVLASLLAVAMVTILGNLDSIDQMVDRLSAVSAWHLSGSVPLLSGVVGTIGGIKEVVFGGAKMPPFDYWRSSRMMPPQMSITEFPYFTFLFADLHAHLMALPFDVLTLALAFALVATPSQRTRRKRAPPGRRPDGLSGLLALDGSWLLLAMLALVVGSLRWINSWDYPPFLLFGIAAVFLSERARGGRLTRTALARGAIKAVALVVLSFLFFLPFQSHYDLFYTGLHKTAETTPLRQYLAHFGLFMFLAWSLLAFLLYRSLRNWGPLRRTPKREGEALTTAGRAHGQLSFAGMLAGAGATMLGGSLLYAFITGGHPLLILALVVLAAFVVGAWASVMSLSASPLRPLAVGIAVGAGAAGVVMLVMALIGLAMHSQFVLFSMILMLLAVAFLAWRELSSPRPDAPIRLFVLAMLGLAFGLSAGVDVVTLDGDIARMNTVFKFYLHIWVLLALAGSFAAWYLLAVLRLPSLASLPSRLQPSWPPWLRRTLSLRSAWIVTLALLLIGAFLYPAAATPQRVQDRFGNGGHTNNGFAFMEDAVFQDEGGPIELKYDLDAIDWLRNNVTGSPVTIEASTPEYRWGSRFAIYTGLPTVIGWRWHQTQQRGSFASMVETRLQDVTKFYTTTDPQEAEAILHKYGVSLVILGDVERQYYPGPGLDKFDEMEGGALELVYENPQTKIYRVVEEDLTPLVSAPSP